MMKRSQRRRDFVVATLKTAVNDAKDGLALAQLLLRRRSSILWRATRDRFRTAGRRHRRAVMTVSGALAACLWVLAVGLGANLRFAATVLPAEPVDLWTINRPPSVTVLSRDGQVLGQRGVRYADPVPVEELPPYAVDAFLATEDRRYYDHRGFDLRGLARAAIANWRAGSVVEGGSTITQQLAKNLFLTSEKTLSRKLEELQLALWLEARLEKEEILSLYLNRIYLGAGAYGIEAAAQAYFSKSARDLTVSEAALIAGLPKAPSSLSPTINAKGAQDRAREVIENLLEAGKIDPLTGGVAKRVPPALNFSKPDVAYGYFIDHVTVELKNRIGQFTDDVIVTSTLDLSVQQHAEASVAAGIDDAAREQGAEQAALVAFDEEGGVAAMVGGLDYEESQFNRATLAKRQTGSAFKPFVYLAAMEAGLSPETVVVDQPIRVDDWAPRNYAETHRGPMRLTEAAARSVNSVAVQLTEAIGRERVIDAAHRAGIEEDIPGHASIALGSVGMSLIDLVGAYLPFAHHGADRRPHSILEVRTRRTGRVLYTFDKIEGLSVIEPAKADDTARLLVEVMASGTGRRGRIDGHPSAGKTGTTNDWRDAWFVGFTRHFTAGVWVGNDINYGMKKVSGATIPLTVWHDFMTRVHQERPSKPLFPEDDVQFASIRDVAGVYQSLRNDLFEAGYPAPTAVDEPLFRRRPWRSRSIGRRSGEKSSSVPTAPTQSGPGFRSPGVEGNAAPGVESVPRSDSL